MCSRAELLDVLNWNAMAYYTNSQIHMNMRKAQDLAWQDFDALRVPYDRGYIYMMDVNAQIHIASGGKAGLDKIVLGLLGLRRNGLPCGRKEWIQLLGNEVGRRTAESGFSSMIQGIRIVPPLDSIDSIAGKGICLVLEPQETLDFGMSGESFDSRVVLGVSKGSRAADADVREGDEMIRETSRWFCGQDFTRKMHMFLRRDGLVIQREYWPRSFHKAESWHWEEDDKRQVWLRSPTRPTIVACNSWRSLMVVAFLFGGFAIFFFFRLGGA